MKPLNKIISMLALLATAQAASALILPIDSDAYSGSGSTSKTGSSTALNVSSKYKGLMRFNFDALPSNIQSSDIQKANLVFYARSLPKPGRLQINPITSLWTESSVGSALNVAFDLDTITTQPITRSSSFNVVDVTSLVSYWVDHPDARYGLLIQPELSDLTSIVIDTKETTSSGKPAYIDIQFKNNSAQSAQFEYKIGDTGPGGGIIFFVDRYDEYPGFTYLEAAPEPQTASVFCDQSASYVGWTGHVSALGSGRENTQLLSSCTSGAVKLAFDFSTSTATDWYLPNFQEYKKLFSFILESGHYAFQDSVTQDMNYWTSNNFDSANAYYVFARNGATVIYQSLNNALFKSWPIRSF